VCVTTNVSVACPLTGAGGAVVPLAATALSGIGPFRLYHRYVVGYALDASPFTTTFKVRRFLNSFEKDGATEDRYKNHMEQKGDREIP
jgi:hypothetical protein